MPTWDPQRYLKFADYRTRACRDLADRVKLSKPTAIIDLGCGPGNSTAALSVRWPDSTITGLDNSEDMITAARAAHPKFHWRIADIQAWATSAAESYDLVFSNAAMHWTSDHRVTFPNVLRHVSPGGAMAIQVPANLDAPAHTLMRELVASAKWKRRFPSDGVREWHVHDESFYYDVLAPHSDWIDLWITDYIHVMDDANAIVEWYAGTGLRPFLDALSTADLKDEFTADYAAMIAKAYPARVDGRVLFPFRRLFMIAYR